MTRKMLYIGVGKIGYIFCKWNNHGQLFKPGKMKWGHYWGLSIFQNYYASKGMEQYYPYSKLSVVKTKLH